MRQRAFSLLEMVMGVFFFLVITGAVFGLLNMAQQRYQMESEFLDSFQGARLALDQITRDIHSAGYPPAANLPAALAATSPNLIALPFAWEPGYPGATCLVPAGCTTPSDFDVIIESDIDPTSAGVEWVRYRLNGNVLERGVASKSPANPDAATQVVMMPYVENVMNRATPAEMAFLRNFYPALFPGNVPVPVFRYVFDPGQPGTPRSIREVNITLIVKAPNLDPRTAQPRVLTLTGLARRFNPS